MIDVLPYVLTATTLTVRVLLAKRNRLGWWLDIFTVPLWLAFYAPQAAYPLMALTLAFGALDVRALAWWKRGAP